MVCNKDKSSRADLHNHTTASDGLLTPVQLVEYASQMNLSAIAITDHDTVDGIDEAITVGDIKKIEVIPGIEINTQVDSNEIHILGYFINWKSSLLQEKLTEMKSARKTRTRKMIHKLTRLYGFDITYEELINQAEDSSIGRLHIARALLSKGLVADISEAFHKYLGVDCPAYVDRYHLSPEEGIWLIRRVGGAAVLAHPGLLADENLLYYILNIGIDGIEAFHSKHTQEQERYYASIAKQNGLLITGGSDCHGEIVNGMPSIGDVTIGMVEVESLRRKAMANKMNNCKS
jgi:predicted metal-dependent phosphoesterase TrpH